MTDHHPTVSKEWADYGRWPGYTEQSWQQRFAELDKRHKEMLARFEAHLRTPAGEAGEQPPPYTCKHGCERDELIERLSNDTEAMRLIESEVAANKAVDCPIDRVGGSAHKICPDCRATSSMICRKKAEAAFETVRRIDALAKGGAS